VAAGRRRVLDVTAFQEQCTNILAETGQLLNDVAHSEVSGKPYMEFVKTALFNADGTRNGRGVADLVQPNVCFEVAQARAGEAYEKSGGDSTKVDGLIRTALDTCGDDHDATAIVMANINRILVHGDELRDEAGVREQIDGLKSNLDELRELNKTNPKVFEQGVLMLKNLGGKSVPRGILTRLVEEIDKAPLDAFKNLSKDLSYETVSQIVKNSKEMIRNSGASEHLKSEAERRPFFSFVTSMLLSRNDSDTLKGCQSMIADKENTRTIRKWFHTDGFSAQERWMVIDAILDESRKRGLLTNDEFEAQRQTLVKSR
jgi:hypothetical protein